MKNLKMSFSFCIQHSKKRLSVRFLNCFLFFDNVTFYTTLLIHNTAFSCISMIAPVIFDCFYNHIRFGFSSLQSEKDFYLFTFQLKMHTYLFDRSKYTEHNSFDNSTVNSKCLDTSNKMLSDQVCL